MAQKLTHSLPGVQLKAAQLVAFDELTDEAIAREVGVGRRTLERWKSRPDFAQHVALIRIETAAALKAKGIAIRENRIANHQDLHDRLVRIIEERGADPAYKDVPGWTTGLLVHDVKNVGGGEAAHGVDLYEVDTGLIAAINANKKQLAQDAGQWTEKHEDLGKGATVINTVYVGVPRPDFTQLAQVVEVSE